MTSVFSTESGDNWPSGGGGGRDFHMKQMGMHIRNFEFVQTLNEINLPVGVA